MKLSIVVQDNENMSSITFLRDSIVLEAKKIELNNEPKN